MIFWRVMTVLATIGVLTGCSWVKRQLPEAAPAEKITMASLFQDNMVLQREMEVPVWGWCEPGRKVTVEILGQQVSAVAGRDGRWEVRLKPMKAGGPVTLQVKGKNTLMLKNVMIGEVWICSGQSNMQWSMARVDNADKEIAAARHPRIRLFSVPLVSDETVQARCGGNWKECSPATVRHFSGVGYYFGRRLHRDLNVSVGLIMTAWGGTRIQAWMPREMLEKDLEYRDCIEEFNAAATDFQWKMDLYRSILAKKKAFKPVGPLPERHTDPGNRGFAQGWAKPDADLSEWLKVGVPTTLSAFGGINGAVWFRRDIDVPASWAGRDLELSLGVIDDFDTTYFNNEKVGAIGIKTPNFWITPRRYVVPGRLVKAGRNVIAVRVFDHYASGGFMSPSRDLQLYPVRKPEEAIALAGPWRARVELALYPFQLKNGGEIQAPLGPGHRNAPGGLWNAMVKPLIPFAFRGVIWYQGESNSGQPGLYRRLLPDMIRAWRQGWGYDFPFMIVQLPNFMPQWPVPQESKWAEIRDAQMKTSELLPQVGCAVTIDLGVAEDIHPRNKLDVGNRLALMTEAMVYHKNFSFSKDFVYTGPVLERAEPVGDKVRLSFTHLGHGLMAKGGGNRLRYFALAGKDGKFVWANAEIKGDKVLVWNGNISAPVTVRYAWADNPAGCNLYNKDGFPAAPFQAAVTRPGSSAAAGEKPEKAASAIVVPAAKPAAPAPAPAPVAPKATEPLPPKTSTPATSAPKAVPSKKELKTSRHENTILAPIPSRPDNQIAAVKIRARQVTRMSSGDLAGSSWIPAPAPDPVSR